MNDQTILDLDMDIQDGAWADLDGAAHGVFARIGVLQQGMSSGLPAVELAIRMDDGAWVIAETSLRLFQSAAQAFTARYGDLT